MSERCQELVDEYNALRRRVEEMEFTNPDVDDPVSALNEEEKEDLDRLREIREVIDEECDIELPDEDESDIDLPEYADGAPSEPMDFDAE